MMTMKGADIMSIAKEFSAITRMLNTFVRQFDEDYSVKFGADFQALLDDCTIQYSVIVPQKSSDAFYHDFITRFPACSVLSVFCLSFLHELGHLETEWDMIDDTEERNAIRNDTDYFNLYNETIATNWAGNYATENIENMKNFDKKISEKIKKVLDKLIDA